MECNINYATYAALLKHARQKNHSLEGVDKSSRAIESQRCSYKLPLMSNKKCDTSQPATTSQQSSQIVIFGDQSILNHSNGLILLPISSVINSSTSNATSSSTTCFQNRSFGCQASEQSELISTQETGSQTVVYTSSIQTQYQQTATSDDVYSDNRFDQFEYNRNHQRFNQYDLNATQSQETQTVIAENINGQEQQQSELVPDDYFYSDAATSPLINLEVLLNDMSTQTMGVAGSQEGQKQSLLADQVGQYNTRCVTPSNFASCQTDQNEYLFDQLLNASASASTMSSYTQTTKYNYSHNVVETQTDWNDFSFK